MSAIGYIPDIRFQKSCSHSTIFRIWWRRLYFTIFIDVSSVWVIKIMITSIWIISLVYKRRSKLVVSSVKVIEKQWIMFSYSLEFYIVCKFSVFLHLQLLTAILFFSLETSNGLTVMKDWIFLFLRTAVQNTLQNLKLC